MLSTTLGVRMGLPAAGSKKETLIEKYKQLKVRERYSTLELDDTMD